mmetsp:Transcript_24318/g.38298  ORF Transcript_24318/g.38298 Transcript_24318/m.38298 type:complete len:218 (-) Transcript_24318:1965-2618(-)
MCFDVLWIQIRASRAESAFEAVRIECEPTTQRDSLITLILRFPPPPSSSTATGTTRPAQPNETKTLLLAPVLTRTPTASAPPSRRLVFFIQISALSSPPPTECIATFPSTSHDPEVRATHRGVLDRLRKIAMGNTVIVIGPKGVRGGLAWRASWAVLCRFDLAFELRALSSSSRGFFTSRSSQISVKLPSLTESIALSGTGRGVEPLCGPFRLKMWR